MHKSLPCHGLTTKRSQYQGETTGPEQAYKSVCCIQMKTNSDRRNKNDSLR